MLLFANELDSHKSPRERTPRDRLSRASRCAGGGEVDGAVRHDEPSACVRRPKVARFVFLSHTTAPTEIGKTTAHTHRFHGRFMKLVTDEQVVEMMEFETTDPAMTGEMTITYMLTDTD